MTEAIDPNADLLTMDFIALTLEHERLKEKGRSVANDDSLRAGVQALDYDDLVRLTKIIQIKRRLSGGQPKASGEKKPSPRKATKPAASTDDIMNI